MSIRKGVGDYLSGSKLSIMLEMRFFVKIQEGQKELDLSSQREKLGKLTSIRCLVCGGKGACGSGGTLGCTVVATARDAAMLVAAGGNSALAIVPVSAWLRGGRWCTRI